MHAADVYKGSQKVAEFSRSTSGFRLTLLADEVATTGPVATSLKADREGPTLPNFFLNLLPEGARLELLLKARKQKEDDLDLLLKIGWDSIGDISVVSPGAPSKAGKGLVDTRELKQINFWEEFHRGVETTFDATVSGVQEKISTSTVAFTVGGVRTPSSILKLNPFKYPLLVQNEHFFLRMARACGLEVNEAKVVFDRDQNPGLLVRRFDRAIINGAPQKLHQEDGCQLLDIPPGAKYHVNLQQLAEAVAHYSSAPEVEILRLLRLYLFSYLIGNGDLHAKNISLLWTSSTRLTPGYDLLSTLFYPKLDQHMAIKMAGKDLNFKPKSFQAFGSKFGIKESAITRMIGQVTRKALPWVAKVPEIGFDEETSLRVMNEIERRIKTFA